MLDTNVLLQDPFSIYSFEDNDVIIPAVVLEEIDSKKRYMDEIGRNARQVRKNDRWHEKNRTSCMKGFLLKIEGIFALN